MGNRCAIKTESSNFGIYLHWNGGVESILAFLEAAKQMGVRDPVNDDSYCMARLTQIIGNFFGGTTSIGIGENVRMMDYSDNGIYVIGKDFAIVDRINAPDSIKKVEDLDTKQLEYYNGVLAETLAKNKQLFGE